MIHITELDWEKSYIFEYPFKLVDALDHLYYLEPDGLIIIRDNDSLPMAEEIKEALLQFNEDPCNYHIDGGVASPTFKQAGSFKALSGHWNPIENEKKLYIFTLNEHSLKILKEKIDKLQDQESNLAFHAEWLSYCKNGQTLIDVVHAYDGVKEQIYVSHKLSEHKLKQFLKT